MLVLTRKPHQQIMIGDNVIINVVEVQGDHVARVVAWLQGRGRVVKRAGG